MPYIFLFLALFFAHLSGVGVGKTPDNRPPTEAEKWAVFLFGSLALLCVIPVALQLH